MIARCDECHATLETLGEWIEHHPDGSHTHHFEPTERECIEPGCATFPDATWYRCAEHQTAYEARARRVRPVS